MGNLAPLLIEAADSKRGSAAPWLEALRNRGRAEFSARGLPNRRDEAWRYSDLARALADEPDFSGAADRPLPEIEGAHLVAFDDGVLNESLSQLAPAGAISLRPVLTDRDATPAAEIGRTNRQSDHPILGLNLALMEEGLVLTLPEGKILEKPIHLRFQWRGTDRPAPEGRHIRILIELQQGSQATILETHDGCPGFATIVSEVRLARSAALTHLRVERLGSAARQSAATLGELEEDAQYRGFYLSEGGHFCRHEALLKLAGEGAEARIDGAYLLAERRHCDNRTVLTHAAPRTQSRQTLHGVLGGQSRGVYQGCVRVEPLAQGTDARQMSRALLLSHSAEIATKPELEIFADDVKCGHGATAGELDAAALFFLRSRGIPEPEARALLVEAFLGQTLETIENGALRQLAARVTQDWLALHAGEVAHVE